MVQCEIYSHIFAEKSFLSAHFNLIHEQKSKHECDFCNRKFDSVISFEFHVKKQKSSSEIWNSVFPYLSIFVTTDKYLKDVKTRQINVQNIHHRSYVHRDRELLMLLNGEKEKGCGILLQSLITKHHTPLWKKHDFHNLRYVYKCNVYAKTQTETQQIILKVTFGKYSGPGDQGGPGGPGPP